MADKEQSGKKAGSPDGPTRRRRSFSDGEKLRILEAAERCTEPGELGLLLRREGIYSSHLSNWRSWRRRTRPEHPKSDAPATQSQLRHEKARLERENARLRLKLEHAEKLLALQKKLSDLMETLDRPETAGRGGSLG